MLTGTHPQGDPIADAAATWVTCRVTHHDAPGLGDLVAEVGAFLAGDFGRRPVLSRRADADRDLTGFPTPDGLWADFLGRHQRSPGFRMVHQGDVVPRGRTCRTVGYGNTNLTDVVDARSVLAEYRAGATMVLQGLQYHHPALSRLANNLALELDRPVQVNAYLTPQASSGLNIHFDYHDVFVVQLGGRKRWRVWNPLPRTEVPLKGGPSGALPTLAELGSPLLSEELVAGDVLYLPRGFPHVAEAVDDSSAHLTVGLPALTWDRALRAGLDRARADRAVREDLPDRFLSGPALPFADSRAAFYALATSLDPLVLRRWVAHEVWGRQPQTRFGPLTPPELSLDTPVQVTPGPLLWVCPVPDDPERVEFGLGDHRLTLPAEAAGFLGGLCTSPGRFVAADWAGDLDHDSRMVVLRRLAVEGVVTPLDPGVDR